MKEKKTLEEVKKKKGIESSKFFCAKKCACNRQKPCAHVAAFTGRLGRRIRSFSGFTDKATRNVGKSLARSVAGQHARPAKKRKYKQVSKKEAVGAARIMHLNSRREEGATNAAWADDARKTRFDRAFGSEPLALSCCISTRSIHTSAMKRDLRATRLLLRSPFQGDRHVLYQSGGSCFSALSILTSPPVTCILT